MINFISPLPCRGVARNAQINIKHPQNDSSPYCGCVARYAHAENYVLIPQNNITTFFLSLRTP